MPVTAEMEERLVQSLYGSSNQRQEHYIHLAIGGVVHVVTNVSEASVGVFNMGIDGRIEELSDITTEPVNYKRSAYVHGENTELWLDEAKGVVDAVFIEVDGELIAYDKLATARDLEHLDSLKFEAPLIEIE